MDMAAVYPDEDWDNVTNFDEETPADATLESPSSPESAVPEIIRPANEDGPSDQSSKTPNTSGLLFTLVGPNDQQLRLSVKLRSKYKALQTTVENAIKDGHLPQALGNGQYHLTDTQNRVITRRTWPSVVEAWASGKISDPKVHLVLSNAPEKGPPGVSSTHPSLVLGRINPTSDQPPPPPPPPRVFPVLWTNGQAWAAYDAYENCMQGKGSEAFRLEGGQILVAMDPPELLDGIADMLEDEFFDFWYLKHDRRPMSSGEPAARGFSVVLRARIWHIRLINLSPQYFLLLEADWRPSNHNECPSIQPSQIRTCPIQMLRVFTSAQEARLAQLSYALNGFWVVAAGIFFSADNTSFDVDRVKSLGLKVKRVNSTWLLY